MHQDDIPSHLQAHFGTLDNPFVLHQRPFEHILTRALALLLAQGKDPASPAIMHRLTRLKDSPDAASTFGNESVNRANEVAQEYDSGTGNRRINWLSKRLSSQTGNIAGNTRNTETSNETWHKGGREVSWEASQVASSLLNSPAFFEGLAKRPAFGCSQFLQAVANELICLDDLAQCSAETVFETLLAIKGIGPDTAEAMVLYAFDIPFIPVNGALYRIAHRHGKIPEVAEREEIRDCFFNFFPAEANAIRQTHSHLLAVGRQFCTSSKALCAGCPLKDML